MDILGASVAATVCFLLVRYFAKKKDYKTEHRAASESAYRSLSVTSSDPGRSFEGTSAQVMSDEEEVEEIRGAFLAYVRTIIFKNDSGEYFWFHFRTDSPPMFKHIDQGRASVLLKEKYIAPFPKTHGPTSQNG